MSLCVLNIIFQYRIETPCIRINNLLYKLFVVYFILQAAGDFSFGIVSNRVSELRVVELLDGLCDKMQDYTLRKVMYLGF